MGDRMDEMKGHLKEGAGRLTGDSALEAEGSAQADAAEARRETKGALREAGGAVKEGVGNLLDSPTLRAEGEADQLRGRAERAG